MFKLSLQPSRLSTLLTVSLLVIAPKAMAQTLLGVDPYRPYNRNYIPFAVPPTPSSNFNALEGSRYDGASRANQMSAYYESLKDAGDGSIDGFRRSGAGLPYSAANRQYDREFGRQYRPNETDTLSDTQYYIDQEARSQKYFEALRETDPRKRAEMLRKYEEDALSASRALGPNARRPTTAAATPSPANPSRSSAPASTRREPSPGTSSLGRNLTPLGSSTLVPPRASESRPLNVPEAARSGRTSDPALRPSLPSLPSRVPSRRLNSPFALPERVPSPYLPPDPAAESPPR